MTTSKPAPGYVPNPDFSQEDWDEVSDTPDLTEAEIAELRPNGEGLPVALADAFKRLGGRPKSEAKAVPVSLRVPPDVLAAYKADGPGWQTRMNQALADGGHGLLNRVGAHLASEGDRVEFRRGPQIQVQMELTPEQYTAMKEWSASIPTLYFLDICVVNMTKGSSANSGGSGRRSAILRRIRDLDRPQNSFSYLLALIEKASDTRGLLSDAELERQVLSDVRSLRGFIQNARVVEPDDFLIGYIRNLRRAPHELSRPNYLRYLETANSQFALKDPVAPRLRLRKAEELLEVADAMSVPRQHPVVLLTLACLYGNGSAKKLMKFRADANHFNAENALADIMVISRFAPLKLEIEHGGRSGKAGFLRSEFITDDDGLSGIMPCFEVQTVGYEAKGDRHQTRIDMRVKLERLLTDLKIDSRAELQVTDDRANLVDEYQQLCAWLT